MIHDSMTLDDIAAAFDRDGFVHLKGVLSAGEIEALRADSGAIIDGGWDGYPNPTDYEGVKVQPADWWEQFWQRHQKESGDTREEAIAKLRHLLDGQWNYQEIPVSDLYVRTLLKAKEKA